MKNKKANIAAVTAIATGIYIVFGGMSVGANDTFHSPQNLREIMQGLGVELTHLTQGLLNEDLHRVEKSACAIAEHPHPSAKEHEWLKSTLGADLPEFKAKDGVVHDAANKIKLAASNSDFDAALSAYQEMFDGCVACHRQFRARVVGARTEGDQ